MNKKILVIDGHPDPSRARLTHALADAYVRGARVTGKETRLITVADAAFPQLRSPADFLTDPDAPSILRAREDLLWAEHIVIVFPLWLGGAPSLLLAFFEQVARGGFVAETDGRGIKQKLKGRSARLIVTMGMPALFYRLVFRARGVLNLAHGVLGFGGVAPVRLTLFGAVGASGDGGEGARIARVEALGREGA